MMVDKLEKEKVVNFL